MMFGRVLLEVVHLIGRLLNLARMITLGLLIFLAVMVTWSPSVQWWDVGVTLVAWITLATGTRLWAKLAAKLVDRTGKTDVDLGELGQSLHSPAEHLDRKYIQGSTSEYRTLMDRLLSDKRIRPSEPTKPEDEVVTVSIYIAEHAVKRSGKNIESLSAGETFVAMLIALVSANVLSAAANVSFELTGGVACTGLCLQIHPHKKGEEIGTLVREVIDDHNKMVTDPDSKIVEAIGTQTEKFFSTANDEYLSKQSELFQMLSKKLAEGS